MKNVFPAMLAAFTGTSILFVGMTVNHTTTVDSIAQVQCSGVDARGLYFRRRSLPNGTCRVTYSRGSDGPVAEVAFESSCTSC